MKKYLARVAKYLVFPVAACLIVGFVLLMGGCGSQATKEERQQKWVNELKERLPPGAANIKEHGAWVTFDWQDPETKQTHRFLYRSWGGSHGEIGHTLTRLK